ncbi:hypothetical protein [Oecophyllibacter saccharovorans]|uniref:Uncharacterized protein n=1 Tax=Oecophyllibacter saccharovorans TaxID=2558360 RepID=A0A506UMS8_9PROT|nr:hypothetical protein [Oecophyllibacter saccharovorans]TPW34433.1 hypothetical protein E3202_08070 [Oecophyllibacter saccharovorans]
MTESNDHNEPQNGKRNGRKRYDFEKAEHMSRAQMNIRFTGYAVENGEMSVNELAPSLLAFGKMLEAATHVIDGKETSIQVNIKAAEKGSFIVSLDIVQGIFEQVWDFFKSPDGNSLNNLLTALGFCIHGPGALVVSGIGYGLIEVIKKIRGRKIISSRTLEDGNVKLSFKEGDKEGEIIVPPKVAQLFSDPQVRNSLAKSLRPLQAPGIESMDFQMGDEKPVKITKMESEWFETEDSKEIKEENEATALLKVVGPNFEDGKWLFSEEDGGKPFSAEMRDEKFHKRVDEGEISFRAGDMLRCKILKQQIAKGSKLKNNWIILEVLDHIVPIEQSNLFDNS